MGFFDTIFGSKPEVKQYPTLTPKQQALAGKTESYLTSGVGKELPGYEGSYVAGPSSQEKAGLGLVSQYAAGKTPSFQWGQTGLKSALSGAPSTTINPETSEQFYQSAVKAPALKEFSEDILPQIRESNNRGGFFWGTARQKAENDAFADLTDSLTSRRSEISYADEAARRGLAESAADRQLSAVPQALSYSTSPIETTMNYGGLERNLEQQNLQAQYADWLRTRPETSPLLPLALQDLTNAQFGMYQQPASQGIFGPMMQMAASQQMGQQGQGQQPGGQNALNWWGSSAPTAQTYQSGQGWTNVGANIQGK